jgi:hypothetical protein
MSLSTAAVMGILLQRKPELSVNLENFQKILCYKIEVSGKNRFGILGSHWLRMWFSFSAAAVFSDMMKWRHFIMVYIMCHCIVQFLASLVVSCTADHNLWVVAILKRFHTSVRSAHCCTRFILRIDHVFTLYLSEVPVINSVMPVSVKRSFQVVSQILCNCWICAFMLVLLSKISSQKYMKQTNCEVAHWVVFSLFYCLILLRFKYC